MFLLQAKIKINTLNVFTIYPAILKTFFACPQYVKSIVLKLRLMVQKVTIQGKQTILNLQFNADNYCYIWLFEIGEQRKTEIDNQRSTTMYIQRPSIVSFCHTIVQRYDLLHIQPMTA